MTIRGPCLRVGQSHRMPNAAARRQGEVRFGLLKVGFRRQVALAAVSHLEFVREISAYNALDVQYRQK